MTPGYALATSTLSSLVAVRLANVKSLRNISLIQFLALLLLMSSLIFVITAGIISLGLGTTNLTPPACSASTWLWCVVSHTIPFYFWLC